MTVYMKNDLTVGICSESKETLYTYRSAFFSLTRFPSGHLAPMDAACLRTRQLVLIFGPIAALHDILNLSPRCRRGSRRDICLGNCCSSPYLCSLEACFFSRRTAGCFAGKSGKFLPAESMGLSSTRGVAGWRLLHSHAATEAVSALFLGCLHQRGRGGPRTCWSHQPDPWLCGQSWGGGGVETILVVICSVIRLLLVW